MASDCTVRLAEEKDNASLSGNTKLKSRIGEAIREIKRLRKENEILKKQIPVAESELMMLIGRKKYNEMVEDAKVSIRDKQSR